MAKRTLVTEYVRSAFFGAEDSLVATTGLVAGTAAGTSNDHHIIILAGIVAIAVEAVSMAAGEFISEETVNDLGRHSRRKLPRINPVFGGFIMFTSYFAVGLIPLAPLIFIAGSHALPIAIACSLTGLFALGLAKGLITKRGLLKSGIEVLLIGGLAALIGILVGRIFKI